MTKFYFLYWGMLFMLSLLFTISCQLQENTTTNKMPNVIIIYADDLGYGDVGCYGASNIPTPNIDRMAANGLRFTDAHSATSTCTPSRYSLLTGNYAFRKNVNILGSDSGLLIPTGKSTLADLFKRKKYQTAVIGKWHLGVGDGSIIDWNGEVKPGPLELGFDYSYIIPVTGDRVPTVFLENYRVDKLNSEDPLLVTFVDDPRTLENPYAEPDGLKNPALSKQKGDAQHSGSIISGISRIGYMTGGMAARYADEELPEILNDKAIHFIEANKDSSFFLFYSFHDIHVPRLPNKQFQGKTTMGPRGDAIVQMDWMVGQIVQKLEALNIADNTIIIFSSDNGPVVYDGYDDQSVDLLGNHKPAGAFSGGKYSILEGGNRVPTIVYWPSQVKTGVSNALVSQVDFFASFAQMLSLELADKEAIDSENLLDALLGKTQQGRNIMLEEVYTLALREGSWKYIASREPNSFQWIEEKRSIRSGLSNEPQLYNLENDITESKNLAFTEPQRVQRMDSIINIIKNRQKR